MSKKNDPERVVREIKRKTRRKFSAEEKIRIVLEGLRGELLSSAVAKASARTFTTAGARISLRRASAA
jgi:transposase-like protein